MLYRRRRVRFIVGFAAACVLLTVIIVVAVAASRNSGQLSPEQQLAGGTRSPTAPIAASTQDRPAFARFGGRNILLLPVAVADATIIAYQPVSDTKAVALTPIGQRVNVNGFVRFFRDLFTGTPSMRYYQLSGRGQRAHHVGAHRRPTRHARDLTRLRAWSSGSGSTSSSASTRTCR